MVHHREAVSFRLVTIYSWRTLMARKIVNRKALRAEAEAAERAGLGEAAADETAPGEEKVAKRKPAKRKSRKEAVEVRKRLVWMVCNQSAKVVATFPYHQEEEARKKAAALTQSGKQSHYVQKGKQDIEVV